MANLYCVWRLADAQPWVRATFTPNVRPQSGLMVATSCRQRLHLRSDADRPRLDARTTFLQSPVIAGSLTTDFY
jgi:hypothetical protein